MKKVEPTPNPDLAQQFVDILEPGGAFVFQFVPERSGCTVQPHVVIGTLAKVWPQIDRANQAGAAVFVQINAGTGRLDKDITGIRAYFVDLDGANPTPLLDRSSGADVIVNTSPGKYHGYWLTASAPLNEFKPRQQALARHFNGDLSVCNPARVMRLPGTIHWKSEPFLANIVHTKPKHTP